ncbi:MAG: NAD(P)-binding protein [Rhizobiales bacterium]|nr:NAD(P)-binding protein [Hyphomicrobiales bacterium]
MPLGQIVVLGASHAGSQAVASLRDEGFEGRVILIGAEPHLPYHRPPLSKAFIKTGSEPLPIRAEAFYDQNRIELELGREVVSIDRGTGTVALADGTSIAFDALVYAAGSRVRRAAIEGADLEGICYLKTLDDGRELRRRLMAASEVVIVGGGFIGLEVAATANALGKRVTVLEMAPRLMGRAVVPEISAHFLESHRTAGIDVRLETGLAAFHGDGRNVNAVETTRGERIAAGLVVVGIGVLANQELAAGAGLETRDGVLVDAGLSTSDPRIVAVGDCVRFIHPASGTSVRLEAVQNANDQARCAARNLLGREAAYAEVPWFWSDQADEKLQMAGLAIGAERRVLRPSGQPGRFSVFAYAGDRLLSVESVNRPADHMLARQMLAAGYSPPPEAAGDPASDLKALFKAATS